MRVRACAHSRFVYVCLTTNVIRWHLHNTVYLDNTFSGLRMNSQSLPSSKLSSLAEKFAFDRKTCPRHLVHETLMLLVRTDRQITAADSIQLAETTTQRVGSAV